MERPYRHIAVERTGDVWCVRLLQSRLEEPALYELCDELTQLVDRDGCRNLALSLGPEEPQFLYSVFLAKLVTLLRRLRAAGGGMILTDVGPDTRKIFEACRLVDLFDFKPDQAAAVAAL